MDCTAAGRCLRGFASRIARTWHVGLVLALAAGALAAAPAPSGTPFFTRYTSADYATAPKHLSVATAPDGRVWVGNVEGVLRFAGGRFELIRLPGSAPGRSLAVGPDGRVYVGSYDRFGYLEDLPTGATRYVELRRRFGTDAARFPGDVWDIAVAGDTIYFQTDRQLYVLRADGSTQVLTPAGPLRSSFPVGTSVYCRIEGIGLTRVEGTAFVPVAGGARFAHEGVYDLRRWDGDTLLLMTRPGVFYRADAKGIEAVAPHTQSLFGGDAYEAIELADGSLAVATLGGEVVRLDRELNLLGRFRAGPYPIMQLARDREGGLWIATQGDLVRAQWPSPWTQFTSADGLVGSIQDSIWQRGTRWVATSNGLLAGKPDARGVLGFAAVASAGSETWDVDADGDALLFVARDGVFRIDDGAPERVASTPDPWTLWLAQARADRAYVAYEPGLAVLARDARGWREVLRHQPEGLSVASLVEDGRDAVWLGNWRGAPVRLTLAPDGTRVLDERRFGPGQGLPEAGDEVSHVLTLAGALHAVVDKQFHRWNGERFEPSDAEGLAALVTLPEDLQIRDAPDGTRYAFTSRQLFARRPDEAQWRELHPDAGAASGYTEVEVEADGTLAIAGWNALLRYDPRVAPAQPPVLRTRIESVTSRRADGREQQHDRTGDTALAVSSQHALWVEFALDTAEPRVEFRSRLLGVESAYGPWSPASRREFAALPPGDYTLQVQARTGSGREAASVQLPLKNTPAWWQNRWLALGLGFAALLVAAFWGRWLSSRRVRRVQAHNRRLEDMIDERTRALAAANARLERLASLDGLTGVANRRGFDAALETSYAHARDTGTQLALLMIDVDHFKQFNDRHGHLAGDEALRHIAQELAGLVRENDVLARFGGEEFAVILPRTALPAALARAEAIRRHCSERAAARGDGLSVSIGVAAAVPRAGLEPRELIEIADAALYEAKRKGRDRVEAAPG